MDSFTWRDHPVWLRNLAPQLDAQPDTPRQAAQMEIDHFIRLHKTKGRIRLETDEALGEGYVITQHGDDRVIRGGKTGILYGTYALLLGMSGRECAHPDAGDPKNKAGAGSEGIRRPYYGLRMLDCWDNMDGSIERGYAGRSLWFEDNSFRYEPDRIRQLGRMLASVGINVLCLNNVNVHMPAQEIGGRLLPETAAFAALLRPFGIRLMLSIDFSLPLQHGTGTADPADTRVQDWWKNWADRIWEAIPDLAGFLVKADSEHRPGPNSYGRTHAQGANMLAQAVKPHDGVLVWRAFVYDCMQDWRDTKTDRPCAAWNLYKPLDGAFDDNVILQVKYGPFDFQVREPVSPLLLGMDQTALSLELQLAQEYTGQQIDLFAMPPMWREIFDVMGKEQIHAIAAVSNLGRDSNWTGHPFAALNLFAYGRYAWDPETDPENVITEWACLTYGFTKAFEEILTRCLLRSRLVYEKYTAPLGLCWMVSPGGHYGPSPYGYEFQAWGTYNRADRNAVGIDRTEKGTGFVCQYPPQLRQLYDDPQTCPDRLLLFFHRLPYAFRMRDGRSLIQRIYDDHFEGYVEVLNMKAELEKLPLPEPDRTAVMQRMEQQLSNAREWRDVINTFFLRFSGIPDEKGRTIFT